MVCIYQLERVSHHNPLYLSPPRGSVSISSIIHPTNMRFTEYYVASDLESKTTHKQMLAIQDEIVELNRRRKIVFAASIFLIVLLFAGK